MSTADAASSEDADLLDNFLTPMPESLRISMIGSTIAYIFRNDFTPTLIQKHELGDIFCKYLRLDINVAMTMINSTLNEFFDMYFKNAIIVCKDPEGYIVMAQPQDSSKWGDWNNVITQPIIQSIEDSPVENPEPIISEPVDMTETEVLQERNDLEIASNSSYNDIESSGANSTSEYATPRASPFEEPDAVTPVAETPSNDTVVADDLSDNASDYNAESIEGSVCSANPSDVEELQFDVNNTEKPQETNFTKQQKENIPKEPEPKDDTNVKPIEQPKKVEKPKVAEPAKKNEPVKKEKSTEPAKKEAAKKVEQPKVPEVSKKDDKQKSKSKTPEPPKEPTPPKKVEPPKKTEVARESPAPSKSDVKFTLSDVNFTSDNDDLLSKATIPSVKKKNNDNNDDLLNSASVTSLKSNKAAANSKKTEIKPGKVEKANHPKVMDDEMSFMLETAKVTRQGDDLGSRKGSAARSLSSMSTSSSKVSKKGLQHFDYELDMKTYEIPNYLEAFKMKSDIADKVEIFPASHLLNLWKFKQFYCFNELVLFFQYIYPFTKTADFDLNAYQGLLTIVIDHEKIFMGIEKIARSVELMLEMQFLYLDETKDMNILLVNEEVLKMPMIPLAKGMPSLLMYHLAIKSKTTDKSTIEEFYDYFPRCPKTTFYPALIDCLNRRPDLFILENPPNAISKDFRKMIIRKNPRIYQHCVCYDYILTDLRRAKDLHLRQDYIDSVSQFEQKQENWSNTAI